MLILLHGISKLRHGLGAFPAESVAWVKANMAKAKDDQTYYADLITDSATAADVPTIVELLGVTKDLIPRFSAVDFVRIASEQLGGKGGGGRPDMAQAGGPNGADADKALAAIVDALREKAGAA